MLGHGVLFRDSLRLAIGHRIAQGTLARLKLLDGRLGGIMAIISNVSPARCSDTRTVGKDRNHRHGCCDQRSDQNPLYLYAEPRKQREPQG